MLPGLLLLVLLSPTAPPAVQGAAPPTAEQLIARVRDRYGHCRTYREDARERHRSRDGGFQESGERWSFCFERPRRFRFEHGERARWEYRGEQVVWRDGESRRTWERGGAVPSPFDAGRDPSGLAKSDSFVDWILPLLDAEDLRGEHSKHSWDEARPTGAVTSDPVGGVACWRVDLALSWGRARVWIGDDAGIRRIDFDGTQEPGRHDELDLAPEFDVTLDPAELALSPPSDSGVKPSHVVHLLMILAFVTMGTIGVLLGLRLSQTGRPFTVSAGLIGWFGATIGAAELLGRFIDRVDLFVDLNVMTFVMVAGVAVTAWPIVRKLRSRAGFYVVGVDHATFMTAMRAVAGVLRVPSLISAATPKVKIDGLDFEVASRESWSMFGLLGTERRSRELLERLRPLVGACFTSESLPTQRSAGVRCIAWGAALIVGGVLFGGFLLSIFDRL